MPPAHHLEVQPVDAQRWPDLVALFEGRGGPKSCWCMVWRATGEETRHPDGPSRRQALRRRVGAGVPVGLLGYVDGAPVAWCSVAPRPTYRALGGADYDGVDGKQIWSVVCFYVHRSVRGDGVAGRMLEAAVNHAAGQGARVVEAYPVDRNSPSYRFMGFVDCFEAHGFAAVGRAGTRRHVVARRCG